MASIGISGKIGTGKTETADIVSANHPDKFFRFNFGDLLKLECAERFSFGLDLCYSEWGKGQTILHPDLPNGTMSVRALMQWWGTDVRRKENPLYWVNRMHKHLKCMAVDRPILVDDVRFPDEAEYMLQRGLLVRLHPYPGWEPGEYATHKSETALDNWSRWSLELWPEFGELEDAAAVIMEAVIMEKEE